MNPNEYEEEAARLLEALRPLTSLLAKFAATMSPPPSHQNRRLRKVTPAVIRRGIAGLRSGEMRPIDPSKDPNALADELETDLALVIELEQQLIPSVEQATRSLSSTVENKVAKTLAKSLAFYREARERARTSGNETLKEHVRNMDRALGRGARR